MRAQSPKRRREVPARRQVVRDMLDRYPTCQIDGPYCTGRSECVHERRKRSSNGSILTYRNLVACCVRCNGWVEDYPWAASISKTRDGRSLVVREGDPEWPQLGRNA